MAKWKNEEKYKAEILTFSPGRQISMIEVDYEDTQRLVGFSQSLFDGVDVLGPDVVRCLKSLM